MQISIIIIGTIATILLALFDFILGNAFFLGTGQLILLIFGLTLLFFGLFWKSRILRSTTQSIDNWFAKESDHFLKWRINGKLIDIVFHLLFLVIAFAFFVGRWGGERPVLSLGGDAANVATFAAVLDHPANFANDFIYNTAKGFGFYVSVYIPLIQLIENFVHDYGLAYLVLVIPIIFIQMSGFYTLGKKLYNNRFWAILLSILSLVIIYTESADYWGIYKDPQPRMLFGAILPWVLCLALASLKRHKLRILTMIVIGVLFYIHPVSTPCIAFGVWLGYVFSKPESKKTGRHIVDLLVQGAAFVIAALPFIYLYLTARDITAAGVDYTAAAELVKSPTMGMYRLLSVLGNYVKILFSSYLLPATVAGIVITWFYFKQKELVRIILIWVAGIFIVSFGITIIESLIDEQTHLLPVFVQLNRSLRYIVPLLEILVFLPFALATNSMRLKYRKDVISHSIVYGAGLALLAIFCVRYQAVTKFIINFDFFPQNAVSCWIKGNFFCPQDQGGSDFSFLEYVAENTREDSTFISIPPATVSKIIRYQGLRSISFERKEIGILASTDVSKALYWKTIAAKWDLISDIKDDQERIIDYLDSAKELGANYAVVSTDSIREVDLPYEIVYSSEVYSIIKIDQ